MDHFYGLKEHGSFLRIKAWILPPWIKEYGSFLWTGVHGSSLHMKDHGLLPHMRRLWTLKDAQAHAPCLSL
jgi:hypothetical protein